MKIATNNGNKAKSRIVFLDVTVNFDSEKLGGAVMGSWPGLLGKLASKIYLYKRLEKNSRENRLVGKPEAHES